MHPDRRMGGGRLVRLAATVAVAGSLAGGAIVAPGAIGLSVAPAVAATCTIDPFEPDSNYHGDHKMHDIVALGKNDIWAVGEQDGDVGRPLAYHWNGHKWTRTTPAAGTGGWTSGTFEAVAAHASNDVWAIGQQAKSDDLRLMIQHWDGHRWSINTTVAFPGISYTWTLDIEGAVAISATDAWVVGYAGLDTGADLFTLHWNGHTWTKLDSTAAGLLVDLTGSASQGAWALGGAYLHPAIYHWSAGAWNLVHTFDTPITDLSGLDVTKSGRVVAVGSAGDQRSRFAVAGPSPSWVSQTVPATKYDYTALLDVAVVSGKNIWALAMTGPFQYAPKYPALYRWNGTAWLKLKTPIDNQKGVILEAITNVPGTSRVYAVGRQEYGFGTPDDLLILRVC
jgi:hypothetical protein